MYRLFGGNIAKPIELARNIFSLFSVILAFYLLDAPFRVKNPIRSQCIYLLNYTGILLIFFLNDKYREPLINT